MKKCIVSIPNVDLQFIRANTSHSVLSIVGKRTSILLDSGLTVIQRNVDENPEEEYLCSLVIDIKSPHLVLGGESGIIKIHNIQTGKAYGYMKGHGGRIICMTKYRSQCILSCSEDTTIRLWNCGKLECLHVFGGYLGHRDHVLSLDISLDRKYLASSGTDCAIKVWEIPTKADYTLVHFPIFSSTKIHRSFIPCLKFYGRLLISMSRDNRISAIYPLFSDNPNKRRECDDAVFLGEINVTESLVDCFTITRHSLITISKNMSLIIYDLRQLGKSSKALLVDTFIAKRPRYFDVMGNEMFVLCEDSTVVKIELAKYLQGDLRRHATSGANIA